MGPRVLYPHHRLILVTNSPCADFGKIHNWLARYFGASLCRHLKTKVSTLCLISCLIASEAHVDSVALLYFPHWSTTLAALFCTCCSFLMSQSGSPQSLAFLNLDEKWLMLALMYGKNLYPRICECQVFFVNLLMLLLLWWWCASLGLDFDLSMLSSWCFGKFWYYILYIYTLHHKKLNTSEI